MTTVWQKARERLEAIEKRARRKREATEIRRSTTAQLQRQYTDPHSPMSVMPPLVGDNPERHQTRRLGEDQVGPEPGPFGHQHPGMKW